MNTVKFDSYGVKLIAHRGLSGIEKENTNAAFVAACNRSYYGVETDIHITKDGKFVIIHDDTTTGVTLGKHKINVEKKRFSKLKKIVLPDVDKSTYRKDLKIPLLEEYIGICKKYEKICVLEIKNRLEEKDIEKLIFEIEQLGYIKNVIFISFNYDNCVNLRKRLPENSIQWLIGNVDITDIMIDKLYRYNLDIDIDYRKLNKENVALLHSKGIKVNCWTCDDKSKAGQLVSYGVDYITTNILE